MKATVTVTWSTLVNKTKTCALMELTLYQGRTLYKGKERGHKEDKCMLIIMDMCQSDSSILFVGKMCLFQLH